MELVEFVEAIRQRTDAGFVNWQDLGDDAFGFLTKRASVVIRSVDHDGEHPFLVSLMDNEQRVVDELRSGWYPSEFDEAQPYPWNDIVERLYRAARRSALGIDSLMQSVLDEAQEEPF